MEDCNEQKDRALFEPHRRHRAPQDRYLRRPHGTAPAGTAPPSRTSKTSTNIINTNPSHVVLKPRFGQKARGSPTNHRVPSRFYLKKIFVHPYRSTFRPTRHPVKMSEPMQCVEGPRAFWAASEVKYPYGPRLVQGQGRSCRNWPKRSGKTSNLGCSNAVGVQAGCCPPIYYTGIKQCSTAAALCTCRSANVGYPSTVPHTRATRCNSPPATEVDDRTRHKTVHTRKWCIFLADHMV